MKTKLWLTASVLISTIGSTPVFAGGSSTVGPAAPVFIWGCNDPSSGTTIVDGVQKPGFELSITVERTEDPNLQDQLYLTATDWASKKTVSELAVQLGRNAGRADGYSSDHYQFQVILGPTRSDGLFVAELDSENGTFLRSLMCEKF